MLCTPGEHYEPATLDFVCWVDASGEPVECDTYHVEDYFDAGIYRGADCFGIEPQFADQN